MYAIRSYYAIYVYGTFIMDKPEFRTNSNFTIYNYGIVDINFNTRMNGSNQLWFNSYGAVIVITSYSIHYTKLYESRAAGVRPGGAPDDNQVAGANEIFLIIHIGSGIHLEISIVIDCFMRNNFV